MPSTTLLRVISLTSALALALAGCGDNDILDVDDAIDEGTRRGEQLAALADAELRGAPDDVLAANVAAIALEIDHGQIELAQVALGAAAVPVVLAYAERMLVEHQAHARATDSMLASLGLLPQDNVVAGTLRTEYAMARAELQGSPNPDYTYMRHQVAFHRESAVLAEALVELSTVDEVTLFFEQTHAIVLGQLERARTIFRAF